MAAKVVESGRIILSNADYLHITPYESEDKIGTQTYDIVSIVGDTLSFTPDDNTVNAKEWEFGDTPLVENITLGKIQFAATCVDFQNDVLRYLMGWKTDDAKGVAYAPNSYKDLYAVLEVGFKNEDVVVVVPKLKLNAKAVISTMKTGTGEGMLAGTCYNATLSTDKDITGAETPMAIIKTKDDSGTAVNTTYTVKITGKGSATITIGGGEDPTWSAESSN